MRTYPLNHKSELLFYLSIALCLSSLFLLAVKPKQGILFTLIAKPIIDTAWDKVFFGFKLTYIMGVGVPVILLAHWFLDEKKEKIYRMPLFWFWALYIIWNFITSQLITYLEGSRGLDTFFRVLNGFIGFYMFQRYFREKEDFKRLLIAFLIAGIFPITIGMYEFVSGHNIQVRYGEGLLRSVGFYHDQATTKYYVFQTFAAIMLYWSYFLDKAKVQKTLLTALFISAVISLYKLYVKSGLIAFVLWMGMWTFFQKKYMLSASLIVIIASLAILPGSPVNKEIYKVFNKEIRSMSGEIETERSFAGRWYLWKKFFNTWQESNIMLKLIGSGKAGTGLHNDYLFVTARSGIIGLFLYLLLLTSSGISLLQNVLSGITPLRIMSIMIFCMWLVETIGLVPSGYPSFQWFAWGIMGLSLRIDKDDIVWISDEQDSKSVSPRKLYLSRLKNRKIKPLNIYKRIP